MPLVQIEQDSPEVIADVHRQIAQMAERMRSVPSMAQVAEEFVHGYILALITHGLISGEEWPKLQGAMRAAVRSQ